MMRGVRIVVLGALLLGSALSAVINPALTEWHLIEQGEERHLFPLKDYILQVKSFLPEVYDTNPPYSQLFDVNKPSTMMMLLHEGSYNNKVGRLVWNTIKFDKGFDVSIEECDRKYKSYNSFPTGKGEDRRQIWNWNFFEDFVELSCNGELQYSRSFDEGESHPFLQNVSPEKCRALGDAEVDRIVVKNMKGFYIRGVPKDEYPLVTDETLPPKPPTTPEPTTPKPTTPKPTTPKATTPKPTTPKATTPKAPTPKATTDRVFDTTGTALPTTVEPDNNEFGFKLPTCDCWTAECDFCTNMECSVYQDLSTSPTGITVTSKVGWRNINTIVLFDEDGNTLGDFWWSHKGIGLTGCIACQSPAVIRDIPGGSIVDWNLSLSGWVLKLSIGGDMVYKKKLVPECAELYGNAKRFSFYGMSCANSFLFAPAEMEAGAQIDETCAGACPAA